MLPPPWGTEVPTVQAWPWGTDVPTVLVFVLPDVFWPLKTRKRDGIATEIAEEIEGLSAAELDGELIGVAVDLEADGGQLLI